MIEIIYFQYWFVVFMNPVSLIIIILHLTIIIYPKFLEKCVPKFTYLQA